MRISIWDKIAEKWIPIFKVKNVYQTRKYFEINFNTPEAKTYNTDIYELTFIHSEV